MISWRRHISRETAPKFPLVPTALWLHSACVRNKTRKKGSRGYAQSHVELQNVFRKTVLISARFTMSPALRASGKGRGVRLAT